MTKVIFKHFTVPIFNLDFCLKLPLGLEEIMIFFEMQKYEGDRNGYIINFQKYWIRRRTIIIDIF